MEKKSSNNDEIIEGTSEQLYQIFENRDRIKMKLFKERIDLANELINEIDGKLLSGEILSIQELKELKLKALENKSLLQKINTDPQFKLFLNLSTNKELQNIYTKRLEETILAAIIRLDTNLILMDSRIQSGETIVTPEQEKNILKSKYSLEQLTNIFDGLNKGKTRIDPNRKADFIKLFMDANFSKWKPIKWTGSNPELATMVFKLTGSDPKPSLVNKYFDPKSTYDSHSYIGRIENHAIKQIIKNCIR
ncbi:MAG: hypothetical protein Q8S54_08110 [Bacteroidota bacterium]|nr:hypothetical protein [Bacteroidota bacterium]